MIQMHGSSVAEWQDLPMFQDRKGWAVNGSASTDRGYRDYQRIAIAGEDREGGLDHGR